MSGASKKDLRSIEVGREIGAIANALRRIFLVMFIAMEHGVRIRHDGPGALCVEGKRRLDHHGDEVLFLGAPRLRSAMNGTSWNETNGDHGRRRLPGPGEHIEALWHPSR